MATLFDVSQDNKFIWCILLDKWTLFTMTPYDLIKNFTVVMSAIVKRVDCCYCE